MEEARKKLQQRFGNIRTGGKGSVRRKKVKSGRVMAQEEASEAFKKNLTSVVNSLNTEMKSIAELEFNEYVAYTNVFVNKYTQTISKQNRRSNRGDRPVIIRQQITDYLTISNEQRSYNTELVEYVTQQVNQKTLEELLGLFQLLIDIIQREEYRHFITPETVTYTEKKEADNDNDSDTEQVVGDESPQQDDATLIKAYQRLKIDYSQPLTPLTLRQQYLERTKTEERSDKLRKLRESYFSVLKLIPQDK